MAHRTGQDAQLSALLTTLYTAHSAQVLDVVTRALRAEDVHQAEDIAQDVWLCAWQYLLRGNTIERPAGLLITMARHRVTDHYRLARVRRERPTDTTAATFDATQYRELVAA